MSFDLLATRLAFEVRDQAPVRSFTSVAPQFCVLRFPVVCSEQKKKLSLSDNKVSRHLLSNECATFPGPEHTF